MSPCSVFGRLQENASKPRFCKSLPLGENWKSESMRIIPEEFLRSTPGAFQHRLVLTVSWGNSWQIWLQRDKKGGGLFMLKEDWDEFVDDNLLDLNDVLFFTQSHMLSKDLFEIQVRIYKRDLPHLFKEIHSPRLEPDPNKPSHQQTHASGSRARHGSAPPTLNIQNPAQLLHNPNNPYFVRTLTTNNDFLFVPNYLIDKYELKFGSHGSPMHYIVGNNKHEAFTKHYANKSPCFNQWGTLCKKYYLKKGDDLVCELESSGGVVTAIRVHLLI